MTIQKTISAVLLAFIMIPAVTFAGIAWTNTDTVSDIGFLYQASFKTKGDVVRITSFGTFDEGNEGIHSSVHFQIGSRRVDFGGHYSGDSAWKVEFMGVPTNGNMTKVIAVFTTNDEIKTDYFEVPSRSRTEYSVIGLGDTVYHGTVVE